VIATSTPTADSNVASSAAIATVARADVNQNGDSSPSVNGESVNVNGESASDGRTQVETSTRRERPANQNRQGGANRQNGAQATSPGGSAPRGNSGAGAAVNQGSGAPSHAAQNNAQNNGGTQSSNGNNQHNNSSADGDDFDDTRRRGRRYRDRRGRTRDTRDRLPGSAGPSEVEPTVSEDDVLIPVAGILDSIEDKNTWFIRTEGYFAGSDDVYVANSYIRRFSLRRGDAVTGAIKALREGERREKYNPLVRLDTVNGLDPEQVKNRPEFTKLTPLYPQERLRLETEPHILTTRVIDLVMPIGKGQRALIVSPPKAGKTSVLQAIANAIATNNPECHLMVVLVDERPEEVTDMQRSVKGEVIASTFDRRP
jgi:transcription termination factor Rho